MATLLCSSVALASHAWRRRRSLWAWRAAALAFAAAAWQAGHGAGLGAGACGVGSLACLEAERARRRGLGGAGSGAAAGCWRTGARGWRLLREWAGAVDGTEPPPMGGTCTLGKGTGEEEGVVCVWRVGARGGAGGATHGAGVGAACNGWAGRRGCTPASMSCRSWSKVSHCMMSETDGLCTRWRVPCSNSTAPNCCIASAMASQSISAVPRAALQKHWQGTGTNKT